MAVAGGPSSTNTPLPLRVIVAIAIPVMLRAPGCNAHSPTGVPVSLSGFIGDDTFRESTCATSLTIAVSLTSSKERNDLTADARIRGKFGARRYRSRGRPIATMSNCSSDRNPLRCWLASRGVSGRGRESPGGCPAKHAVLALVIQRSRLQRAAGPRTGADRGHGSPPTVYSGLWMSAGGGSCRRCGRSLVRPPWVPGAIYEAMPEGHGIWTTGCWHVGLGVRGVRNWS